MSNPDRIYVVRVMRDVLVRASDEEGGWQGAGHGLTTQPGSTPEERIEQWRCLDYDLRDYQDMHPLRADGSQDPLTVRELLASGEVSTDLDRDENGEYFY